MAIYSSATFLAPFTPTDTILGFVNTAGKRTGGINVCQYDKSSAEGDEMWISVQDKRQKILGFSSPTDAKLALAALRMAINTLIVNCEFVSSSPAAVPQTIVAITYAAYKIAQAGNSLVPLQWYDVADTGAVFDLGATIRLLAMRSDDFEPQGQSLVTDELVTINVIDNTIIRREDTTLNHLALGQSTITPSNGSTFLKAQTFSSLIADNSTYIEADNHSIVDVLDSSHIKAINQCNIVIENGDNLFFDNIQEDLSAHAGLLNNISVNPTDTIGKRGRGVLDDNPTQTLNSYIELMQQDTPAMSANITKTLDNAIPSANAEFMITVGSGMSTFSITIEDSATTTLAVLTGAFAGNDILFRWNKTTLLYEHVPSSVDETLLELTVVSNGQTSITGLDPVPTKPELSTLEVNGVVLVYGASEDYTIVGGTLFWNDNDFILSTDDKLILRSI